MSEADTITIQAFPFAEGQSVGLYYRSQFPAYSSGGPIGSVIRFVNVAGSELRFSDLTPGISYRAAAEIDDEWHGIDFMASPRPFNPLDFVEDEAHFGMSILTRIGT